MVVWNLESLKPKHSWVMVKAVLTQVVLTYVGLISNLSTLEKSCLKKKDIRFLVLKSGSLPAYLNCGEPNLVLWNQKVWNYVHCVDNSCHNVSVFLFVNCISYLGDISVIQTGKCLSERLFFFISNHMHHCSFGWENQQHKMSVS